MPNALEGLSLLARAGWPLAIISNQSGIARGIYDARGFEATMRRLGELLGPGIRFAAVRFCPHHPDFTGPCDCRKPGTRLFREVAAEQGFDLARSWFVGDRWRDVQPALELGGHGLLVTQDTKREESSRALHEEVGMVPDLLAAARRIIA